jgi:hypothetical protein
MNRRLDQPGHKVLVGFSCMRVRRILRILRILFFV